MKTVTRDPLGENADAAARTIGEALISTLVVDRLDVSAGDALASRGWPHIADALRANCLELEEEIGS